MGAGPLAVFFFLVSKRGGAASPRAFSMAALRDGGMGGNVLDRFAALSGRFLDDFPGDAFELWFGFAVGLFW